MKIHSSIHLSYSLGKTLALTSTFNKDLPSSTLVLYGKNAFNVLDLEVFTELNKNSLLGQSTVDRCNGTGGFYLKTCSFHLLHLAAAESILSCFLYVSLATFQASERGARSLQQHQWREAAFPFSLPWLSFFLINVGKAQTSTRTGTEAICYSQVASFLEQ